MSPVEAVREFVSRRLSAAAGEIFSVFLPTLVQYQEKIQTQQRLLQTSRRETTKSQRTDEPQESFYRKEKLWNNQQHSSLDQEEPEPPQIKEELLGVDQFADTIMVTVDDGESDSGENLDSHNSVREFINQRLTAAAGEIYTEFQQTIIQYQEEIQTQERLLEFNLIPQIKPHGKDSPQQQMNIDLEHEGPDASQIKEEQQETEFPQFKEEEEEFYSSHDEEHVVVKEEVGHLMMIPTSEQSQLLEPGPDSEPFLFQNSVEAGNQHQKNILEDSEATTDVTNGEIPPFTPQSSLSVSRKPQKSKRPIPCGLCEKRFRVPGELLRHMRFHSGEKLHSCETCGKSFSKRGDMLVHMRIHTGEKPFSCETCGKSFSRKSHMLRHMRIHTGEKPFSCEICGRSFSQNSHLFDHMRIHTGEKPHSCVTCGKSFRHRCDLLRHMRIHTG